MLIRSWIVRGLNNPLKQHEVANLMRKNKLDVCGLLEIKLVLSKVTSMQQFSLKNGRSCTMQQWPQQLELWSSGTLLLSILICLVFRLKAFMFLFIAWFISSDFMLLLFMGLTLSLLKELFGMI